MGTSFLCQGLGPHRQAEPANTMSETPVREAGAAVNRL